MDYKQIEKDNYRVLMNDEGNIIKLFDNVIELLNINFTSQLPSAQYAVKRWSFTDVKVSF